MIKEMKLKNFKTFDAFTVSFQDSTILVGPNSAGKSTILTALRLIEACLAVGRRSKSSHRQRHNDVWVQGYPVPVREFEALNESVRHNFRELETSLEVTWKSGHRIRAIWPQAEYADERPLPFFYLTNKDKNLVRSAAQVRSEFSPIGVVPTLSPLEHEERILEDKYVRRNYSSRLSSRHFRNQLRLLDADGEWDRFQEFVQPWLGDFRIKKPIMHYGMGNESSIDVFYTESGSPIEKELVWAGDGIQIWLQLLLHLYRLQNLPTLVLDEPEVFLHADLQRRLVKLLEAIDRQTVLATHSSEVLAEAGREAIVWVDKTRRRAIRAPKDDRLNDLNAALGTAFNLGLARALRARVVLFVEGKDMRILKILAKQLGFSSLTADGAVAVVPIDGYSNWTHVEAFGWLAGDFLDRSVECMILLDRDYRTPSQVVEVKNRLSAVGMKVHVWERKELESYLLISTAISRLTGCPKELVNSMMNEIIKEMSNTVFARYLSERQTTEKAANRHAVSITEEALVDFNRNWLDFEYRLAACPPKEVLSSLNRALQAKKYKATSFEAIARNVTPAEIPEEMARLLSAINAMGA